MTADAFRDARDLLLGLRDDYQTARARFVWPALDRFNWALDWFDAELASGAGRDRVALRVVGRQAVRLSFADLSERSNRVANGLRRAGVRRGDRILLMLGNCPALWEAMLAAMKLGAVTVPASSLLTGADLRERLVRARARCWITEADIAARLGHACGDVIGIATGDAQAGWARFSALHHAPSEFEPDAPTLADDPILLYFTSGTTAEPKLVAHSHRSYGVGSLSTLYWLGLTPDDVHLNVSSPGWAKHAWSSLFAPWNVGCTALVTDFGRFDAATLLDAIVEQGVTSLCAPPTVWRMLTQVDLRRWKPALRNLCSAGEPLNPEMIQVVRAAWGLTIRDGYGQTETTALVANTPAQPFRPGAMGRPLPGCNVLLLDENGQEADEGEVALRLTDRPACLMQGYATGQGEVSPIEGDYYRTGDLAVRGSDGCLTFVGRADDVFKASDYRISPFELESVLMEHPAVAEAAVIPAPDPLRLAVPKAIVSLAAGYAPSEITALSIIRHVRARVPPYKRVRRVVFAELPKTISGKIRRAELRAAEISLPAGSRPAGEYREEDFAELSGR